MGMADGRMKTDWGRTSALMALLANVNRDSKKTDPFKPSDFNPTIKKSSIPAPKFKMSEVKELLMGSVIQRLPHGNR